MSKVSNEDLARRLGSDLSRLRRAYGAGSDIAEPQRPNNQGEPAEAREIVTNEDETQKQVPECTTSLSEMERRALFVALTAGTERHLGRQPTVAEFVRLSEAVMMARQLATLEKGLFYGGAEVYWTGDEWVVQPTEDST